MTRNVWPILLGVVGCASPNAGSGKIDVAEVGRVPRVVGNVTVVDSQVFPTASLGVSYRYGSGEMSHDVYVYSKRTWPDPQVQARIFIDNIEIERRRGRFESYEVISNQSFNLPIGQSVFPGHEVTFKVMRKGEPRHSYMAVVGLADTYAKFRITRRIENSGGERRFVSSWVEAYLKPQ